MTAASSRFVESLPAILAMCLLMGTLGCHSVDFYDHSLSEPVPPSVEPPREKSLVTLPPYRIGPPDMVHVEMIKQVPLPPYRAEAFDVLQIDVVGTLLDSPINDYYMVEAEGTVNLGPAYGSIRVAGMTVEEAKEAIAKFLLEKLSDPVVSVKLARASGTQTVTADYLVGPDGTINLRRYGSVYLAGKTIAEAKEALQKSLSQYFDSPEVSIHVMNFNSKVYYVITEGAMLGESVTRVPITGKEKVLDALSQVGGLSAMSSQEIWIARPAPGGFGCQQILPVDYAGITRGASAATNYQLMPGDRVYVAENKMVALSSVVGIVTNPFEQATGFLSLGTSMIKNLAQLGRGYNKSFRR